MRFQSRPTKLFQFKNNPLDSTQEWLGSTKRQNLSTSQIEPIQALIRGCAEKFYQGASVLARLNSPPGPPFYQVRVPCSRNTSTTTITSQTYRYDSSACCYQSPEVNCRWQERFRRKTSK